MVTYWLCAVTSLDNSTSINKASNYDVTKTLFDNDFEHPTASLGLKNVQDCVAGNKNCDEDLKKCLAGLIAGGILPHCISGVWFWTSRL